jgi:glycosyltransferase involved in cell wall biosynthesis
MPTGAAASLNTSPSRVEREARAHVPPDPIRVLFVSHDSSLYGAQQSLLGLLSRIDPNVIRSYVVTPYMGDLGRELEKLGIPVHVLPITRWVVSADEAATSRFRHYRQAIQGLRSRVAALVALIRAHAIEMVYTNTVTCIDGALAARATGLPHVWHLRERITGNRDLRSLLPVWLTHRLVIALASRIITNSNSLRNYYARVAPLEKISVVHNGVDPEAFCPGPPRLPGLREELSLQAATRLVVMIASITPRKGQLLFAEAAALIRRAIGNVAFLVIGAGYGEYVKAVRARVEELGLNDCCHFLGWRSDVPDVLRASDALVVASDQEPFGRTVVEAMATGLPVVATRCGGPEEIIVDGETGFLVPVGDARAMADAVLAVLKDPDLARRLGKAGRRRAQACFSLQAYASAAQDVLRQVAGQPKVKP